MTSDVVEKPRTGMTEAVDSATILRTVPAPRGRWVRACLALYLGSARELLRDPMVLFWLAGLPLVFVGLFGLISRSPSSHFRIGVAMAPHGDVARQIDAQLVALPGVEPHHGSLTTLLASMRRGDLDGIITLPLSLDSADRGVPANLTVTYDPAHQSAAGIVQSLAAQVADRVDRRLTGRRQLLYVRAEPLNGRVLGTLDYLLPGILAMALLQLGLFGTATPLIQLRHDGVLRHLSATPLRTGVLAASQVALRLTIAMILAAGLILVSHLAFDVQVVGNWVLLALITLLGAAVMIVLGYLLAARVRSPESGNGIIQAVFLPLMFLSGLFIPLEIAPSWMKTVSLFMPTTYLGDALRQVMAGATPQFSLTIDMAVLCGLLVAFSLGAVRLFRWE